MYLALKGVLYHDFGACVYTRMILGPFETYEGSKVGMDSTRPPGSPKAKRTPQGPSAQIGTKGPGMEPVYGWLSK